MGIEPNDQTLKSVGQLGHFTQSSGQKNTIGDLPPSAQTFHQQEVSSDSGFLNPWKKAFF